MANEIRTVLIEQILLKKAIEDSSVLIKLSEDDFISETAKYILKAVKQLSANKVDLNIQNISVETYKHISIDRQHIVSLLQVELPSDSSFEYLYKQLREEKVKVDLVEDSLVSLQREASKKGELDVDRVQEIIRDINSQIISIDETKAVLLSGSDLLNSYEETLKNRDAGKTFYDTGCKHLNDHLMEGFAPQKITTIFGASGVGKSSFGLHLVNGQINMQIPSLYVSLEMDKISTMDRLIAQRHNLPISMFFPENSEPMPQEIFDLITFERTRLGNCKRFFFVEQAKLTIADLEYIVKEAKSWMKVPYLICTVDLNTMLRDFNKTANKASDYEQALNLEHEMVRSTNTHLVGIVQLRRPPQRVVINNVGDLDRFRPRIEEIKNSGAIEERSRVILSTFRAKHYAERLLPDDPEAQQLEDIMDIEVLKQNMGALGRLQYLFMADRSLLMPFEPDEDLLENSQDGVVISE